MFDLLRIPERVGVVVASHEQYGALGQRIEKLRRHLARHRCRGLLAPALESPLAQARARTASPHTRTSSRSAARWAPVVARTPADRIACVRSRIKVHPTSTDSPD